MFNLFELNPCGHLYSFAATGIKVTPKVFSSRQDANHYMHKICYKKGLCIKEVWKDNHDITHVCNKGVKFYIHRI